MSRVTTLPAPITARAPAHVEDHVVEVEEHPLAEQDIRAIVAVEGGLHPDALPARAEQLLEDAPAFLLGGFAGCIEQLAQVACPVSGDHQLRIERIIQFPTQHLLFLTRHHDSPSSH
jgi:hypothetical protein